MVRWLLFLVMQSIRKLPRASGRTTVQRHERHCGQVYAYVKGKTIVWCSLSSTSPNMNMIKEFLAKGSNGSKRWYIICIEDGWGYIIQPFSLSLDEEEVLLERWQSFTVQSVI